MLLYLAARGSVFWSWLSLVVLCHRNRLFFLMCILPLFSLDHFNWVCAALWLGDKVNEVYILVVL